MSINRKEKLIEWTREPKNKKLLQNRYRIFSIVLLVVLIAIPIISERKILINLVNICFVIYLISYARYSIRIKLFKLEADTIRKNSIILIGLTYKDLWEKMIMLILIMSILGVCAVVQTKIIFIVSIIISIIVVVSSEIEILSNKISKYFQKKLK